MLAIMKAIFFTALAPRIKPVLPFQPSGEMLVGSRLKSVWLSSTCFLMTSGSRSQESSFFKSFNHVLCFLHICLRMNSLCKEINFSLRMELLIPIPPMSPIWTASVRLGS